MRLLATLSVVFAVPLVAGCGRPKFACDSTISGALLEGGIQSLEHVAGRPGPADAEEALAVDVPEHTAPLHGVLRDDLRVS